MASSTDEIYKDQTPSDDSNIDFKKLFFKYLAYWKWFALSFPVFLLLGSTYLFMKTPQYKIKASILVKDDKKIGETGMLEELNLFGSKKVVENEMEILRSYTLLDEVVADLNLHVKYTIDKRLRTIEIYEDTPVKVEIIQANPQIYEKPLIIRFKDDRILVDGKPYPKNALITESFGSIRTTVNDSLLNRWDKEKAIKVTIAPKDVRVEDLRNNLGVETSGKGTSVINLSLLSPVPQQGKDILNHLITVYNRASIADKNNLAGITLAFIDERLGLLSADLQNAEQKVEEYKSSLGITNISAEAELFLQSVQQKDVEISRVAIQLDVLQHIEQYVLSNNNGGTTPATLGLSDPTLLSLIASLTETEAERTKALRTMKPANPMVQALDDQINNLKRNIIGNIQTLRRSLEITQAKLKAENKRLELMIQAVPRKERELVDITRQKEIKNQLYVYLLSKREETAISYASTVSDSRLVDAARSSLKPVEPRKNIALLIFGLIGLLLPAGILWLIGVFDDKISSKEQAEKKIKVPIIGEIATVTQSTKILSLQNRSKQAEQIRTLRTNLEFMRAGGGIKTILITSSISGEGKSFLSANLGAAYAALGKKVITLGFDLRKPGLHKVFGIENEEGLSNYLAGQANLSQIVRKVEQVENMDTITCGHIPPNPQELLQGSTLPQLFEELEKIYDYIIIDTPPVGLVSDAIILDRFVDVSIYMIRQNYTPKDRISFINDLHDTKKLKNTGVVVNDIKEQKWHGYYYASYGSSKYYGKYYEEEAGKTHWWQIRKRKHNNND